MLRRDLLKSNNKLSISPDIDPAIKLFYAMQMLSRVCRKILFSSDQFETPGELSLGMDY